MKTLLMAVLCPMLVFLGVVLIGIRPSVKQVIGYFCIYLAGHLVSQELKESRHERNESQEA
jgi:hypothetical protein